MRHPITITVTVIVTIIVIIIIIAGWDITNGQTPVMLSSQKCFCSDITRFWPDKFDESRTVSIVTPDCMNDVAFQERE